MSPPCVVGWTLPEARRLLAEAGVREIAVSEAASLRTPRPEGPLRVVRQRSAGEGVSLVVAASVPPPEGKQGNDGA